MDSIGSLCFDDYGRSFVILKEQERKARLTGPEAIRSNILAARAVADKLRTSLGPKGMDKLLVSPEGDVVITNDGRTILELMDLDHEVTKLMVELARSQDAAVGDGTTGVVVLAGALLENALDLLDRGVHPSRIADGYELAARSAVGHLERMAVQVAVDAENTSWLLQAAMTALGSKVASKCQRHLAELSVEAVKLTCDLNQSRPEVPVSSVVLRGQSGRPVEDTELVRGVVLGRELAHPQMSKSLEDVRVAVLSLHALQLPQVNTRHQLDVSDVQGYDEIQAYMDAWSGRVVEAVLAAGAQFVVYSGKIEESVVHMFLQHNIAAVDTVSDVDLVALAVGASVVPRVEQLTNDKLGRADRVRLIDLGTTKEKLISVEGEKTKVVTILVRGGNEFVVEEVKRSIQDALCVIRNLAKENAVVFGGGAAELACSTALQKESLDTPHLEQLVVQAFAEALEAVPVALAHNAGLFPLQVLTELKARNNPCLGVDCMLTGDCDMRAQGVVEGLHAKTHQLVLATQLAKMVLRIDDVRGPKDGIDH